ERGLAFDHAPREVDPRGELEVLGLGLGVIVVRVRIAARHACILSAMRRCLLVLVAACSTPPSHPAPPKPDAPAARPCELSGRWRDQPDELWIAPNGPTFATVFGVERGTLE